MSDIVERLRETLVGCDVWYQGRIKTSDTLLERFSNERKEAAEEITRLREENEKLRTEVMSDYNEGWEEGLSAMKAENGRIKAAFRVNMLRAFPNMSHEEIDAEIAAAIRVNE